MLFTSNNAQSPNFGPMPTIPRFQTDNEALLNNPEYQIVQETVLQLWEGGIIQRGRGYCLSMADIIHNLLKQKNIKSRIVECKLSVVGIDPPGLLLVGHDGLNKVQQSAAAIDSHVVCITDTEIPMLIDLSVIGVRPEIPWILESLTPQTAAPDVIAEYNFGASRWLYQNKLGSRIPQQHQASILDRFKTDQQVSRSIRSLKLLIVVAICISLLNAGRGAYDFYMVYYLNNSWGPKSMQIIVDKIKRIENHLEIEP